MIIVKLMDGLGNQMFQYAFGRYLQTVYNEPIVFETMKLQKGAVRRIGLHNFNIRLVDKNPKDNECRFARGVENRFLQFHSKLWRTFYEKVLKIPMTQATGYSQLIKRGFYTTNDSLAYYSFEKTKKKNKYIRGYFQSEKYFEPIGQQIKSELKLISGVNEQSLELGRKMSNQNSVAIHIRRGDYIGSKRFEVCDLEYYLRAIEIMRSKVPDAVYYLFSNSPKELDWIRDNYEFPVEINYVYEGKSEFDDMYMMYHCRHHIISNSTFSWWASYLCDNPSNVTIAPKRWVNSDEQQDILRDEWICI